MKIGKPRFLSIFVVREFDRREMCQTWRETRPVKNSSFGNLSRLMREFVLSVSFSVEISFRWRTRDRLPRESAAITISRPLHSDKWSFFFVTFSPVLSSLNIVALPVFEQDHFVDRNIFPRVEMNLVLSLSLSSPSLRFLRFETIFEEIISFIYT